MSAPASPATLRAFIAVPLPPAVQAELAEPVRKWRVGCEAAGLSARWSDPDGWHLTLKFLGPVAADQIAPMMEKLAGVAGRHRPFTIQLDGFGVFPSPRRPRVLWIGVAEDQGRAALVALAGQIEAAVAPLGYQPGERPFHPHLTLARVDQPRALPRLAEFLERGGGERLATVEVGQVALMKSEPNRGGSVYTAIETVPL